MPFDHELSHLYGGALRRAAPGGAPLPRHRHRRRGGSELLPLPPLRLLQLTRAQEAGAGERVLAPGDLEQEAATERLGRGIPLAEGEAAFFETIEAEEALAAS